MTDFDGKVFIQGDSYIYRVKHRIMEGDCEYDHGPRVIRETMKKRFERYLSLKYEGWDEDQLIYRRR